MEQRLEAMSSQLLKKQIFIDELTCAKSALQARLRSSLALVTKLEQDQVATTTAIQLNNNNNNNSYNNGLNDIEEGKSSNVKNGLLRQRSSNVSIARLPPFAKHQTAAKVADTVDKW